MITKFKIFESTQNPDLREMSEYVKCIKNLSYMASPSKTTFKAGNIYKVVKQLGDPERAIEEFGINDYVPLECIGTVLIEGEIAKLNYPFFVNGKYYGYSSSPDFSEYFEVMEESNIGKKYNL